MDEVGALAADDPLPLLGVASSLLAAFDDRPTLGPPTEPSLPPRDEVVQTFVDVELVATSALLAAIARLAGDDVLRHRVRREIAARRHVLPRWLAELVDEMDASADDPDTTLADVAPADTRARITEAMELSTLTFPPIETDTWPACRPLVAWAVGLLPAGGTGNVRPEWTDDDEQALAARFFASPFGAALADADRRGRLR